jgi:hypothetical protein
LLYQFYNSEPKDIVFENLKKKSEIYSGSNTNIHTKWIVQYMVENSLNNFGWNPIGFSYKAVNEILYKAAEQYEDMKQV